MHQYEQFFATNWDNRNSFNGWIRNRECRKVYLFVPLLYLPWQHSKASLIELSTNFVQRNLNTLERSKWSRAETTENKIPCPWKRADGLWQHIVCLMSFFYYAECPTRNLMIRVNSKNVRGLCCGVESWMYTTDQDVYFSINRVQWVEIIQVFLISWE